MILDCTKRQLNVRKAIGPSLQPRPKAAKRFWGQWSAERSGVGALCRGLQSRDSYEKLDRERDKPRACDYCVALQQLTSVD